MAVAGWILDKSAAVRADHPVIGAELSELAGRLFLCLVGQLEQLYSARSAGDYDDMLADLQVSFPLAHAPSDVLERALALQRDLAHHHGMWHRTPIPTSSSLRRRCTTVSASSTSTATSPASPRSDL